MACKDENERMTTEEFIWKEFTRQTGLSSDDLPDCLPLEDFYNADTSEFDFNGISNW